MHITLLSVAIASTLCCGPALADSSTSPRSPPAAAPAPSVGPSQMLRLTLAVKAGAETRTHELALSDIGCGSISDKTAAYEDQIRVCSRPVPGGLLLDTDWATRAGPGEYRTRAELLLPRSGGAGELGRTGGLRLGVTLR
jgi:hypothetical protein